MSSYANASSKYSNSDDGLPSYNQAIQMFNIATAPLLDERLAESIFGTATSLKFKWVSECGPDNYSFLIRDNAGCLQAQGRVVDNMITLTNNGTKMLKMLKKNSVVQGSYVHTCKVYLYNNNDHIASITFSEKEPAATCLKFHHKNANTKIIVRSIKFGDFAIYRDNLSSTPLCNIKMCDASIYVKREFNGTIVFRPETGITAEEQLLCTAAAIAFKVSMKQITTTANGNGIACGCFLAIVFVVIMVGVLVLVFKKMEKQECESRSRGYAGYNNKAC